MKRRRPSPKARLKPEAVWEQLNRRNLSQNELARQVGITSGYLSQLISGSRSPSARVRRRLQEALEIDQFEQLFRLERVDE